jgi:hypothetical protein
MAIETRDYEPFPELKLSVLTCKEYIEAIMEQSDSDDDSDGNS